MFIVVGELGDQLIMLAVVYQLSSTGTIYVIAIC